MTIETEISARIRATVSKLRKTPMPAADLIPLMQTAAEMCDRYYNGMENWKNNAQAKDKSIAELRAQIAASKRRITRDMSTDYVKYLKGNNDRRQCKN